MERKESTHLPLDTYTGCDVIFSKTTPAAELENCSKANLCCPAHVMASARWAPERRESTKAWHERANSSSRGCLIPISVRDQKSL